MPMFLGSCCNHRKDMKEAFILWGGGKESYLSLKKARERGFEVIRALSYVDPKNRRLIGCLLREDLVGEQVHRLGLEFVPVYCSKREGNILSSLREKLRELKPKAGVFGSVKDRESRKVLESLMRFLDIKPVFPLWWMDELVLLKEETSLCKALVVCRQVRKVPKSYLGKILTLDMGKGLLEKGLSPLGENGEYQTFVVGAEEFNLNVRVMKTRRRSLYECLDLLPADEPDRGVR